MAQRKASKNKTAPTTVTVETFIQGVDPKRVDDTHALIALMSEISGEPATMWGASIIGFGSYHYVYESGREGDSPRVGFSPRKTSLVLYIMPGFGEFDALLSALGPHKTGKSCLYVKRLSDIDVSVLRQIVERTISLMNERYG